MSVNFLCLRQSFYKLESYLSLACFHYKSRGTYDVRASPKFWYRKTSSTGILNKIESWKKMSLYLDFVLQNALSQLFPFSLVDYVNAILILDTAYTRRWNVIEIEKLSIRNLVLYDWELVYCRICFKNII
jgi:hypothetical protein